MKKRIDQMLVDNGLVESKNKAQALVMAGQVFAEGHRIDKAGMKLDADANICVKELFPYVSRGALKLEKAFVEFNLDFKGKTVCDIGSSTGGFTDFALQNGAKKVFAIDVGTGQLAQKIREDKRVVVMEKTDFRDVTVSLQSSASSLEARGSSLEATITDPIDIFVCDVSFISLKKIIPKIAEFLTTQRHPLPSCHPLPPRHPEFISGSSSSSVISTPNCHPEEDCGVGRREDLGKIAASQAPRNDKMKVDIILLIKPQFEAGVKEVSRGKGVIRDDDLRHEIVEDIKSFAINEGYEISGVVESPITGAKGNVEYLLYLVI